MIINIRDNRDNPKAGGLVTAVIEETHAKPPIGYDERADLSLQEAVTWASDHKSNVTLFIHDQEHYAVLQATPIKPV